MCLGGYNWKELLEDFSMKNEYLRLTIESCIEGGGA